VDPSVVEQRIVEATVHLPPYGALTGWAALRVAGATYFDGRLGRQALPVPLALGSSSGRRSRPGLRFAYERLDPGDVTEMRGLRVTVPARALYDELRLPGRGATGVVAADMALAARVVTVEEMDGYVMPRLGFRRSHLALEALALADPGSRSPTETRLRVFCHHLGLRGLRTNQPVFDLRGRLICIADLFDEEAGLVIEYDGAEHRTAERQHRDILRSDACRSAGLEYCPVSAPDMRDTRDLGDRILASRRRAKASTLRAWTLQRPRGWRIPW
jgi:very-short-patch-repair endonuclease